MPSSSGITRRRFAHSGSVDAGDVLGIGPRGIPLRTVTVRVGNWMPQPDARAGAAGTLPLLVVDGALQRTVGIRGREGADLLGPGDLLRLDAEAGEFITRFRALTPSRLGTLDERGVAAAAADPVMVSALTEAAVHRANTLAKQVVLAQLVAIDDRLRILFPSLAERFGRVTADGVVLPAFLSHTVLSALVGARRPSLTAAVARLVDDGVLRRTPDRRWILAPALAAVA
jgi:CRP-like cAMP-binding protein